MSQRQRIVRGPASWLKAVSILRPPAVALDRAMPKSTAMMMTREMSGSRRGDTMRTCSGPWWWTKRRIGYKGDFEGIGSGRGAGGLEEG